MTSSPPPYPERNKNGTGTASEPVGISYTRSRAKALIFLSFPAEGQIPCRISLHTRTAENQALGEITVGSLYTWNRDRTHKPLKTKENRNWHGLCYTLGMAWPPLGLGPLFDIVRQQTGRPAMVLASPYGGIPAMIALALFPFPCYTNRQARETQERKPREQTARGS